MDDHFDTSSVFEISKFDISKFACTCIFSSDPGRAQEKLEAMEAARRRMQEQFDSQAARHAEQQKIVSFQEKKTTRKIFNISFSC